MRLFQKNSNPKKLNLSEIWNVYNTIGASAFQEKEYLIDEVDGVLSHMNDSSFSGVLGIMYKRLPKMNSAELLIFFIRSVKENNLFVFDKFVKGLLK